MLKVDKMTIGHGDHPLVRDISFEMAPGECVLLAGANGTGKTTLLKRLAGEGILLIPTNIPKVKGFTVGGFIETGCYRESDWRGRISEKVAKKMEEALEVLGIQELKNRDISTLSDGEFKKACLAVGLTRKAEVLLLDEPTAFLDVENRISVLETLREVARKTGTAVLFSSHDLHDALPVADRVFALTRDGRFLASGPDNREAVLKAAFPHLEVL
jgi:iron complex transport system ATP-binding protein